MASDIVERLFAITQTPTPSMNVGLGNIATIKAAIDHIQSQDRRIAKLEAALEPFAALIERSDGMDLEYLAKHAPGFEIETYTPSSDKLVSSGEMRNGIYVTRGDFRRARDVLRACGQPVDKPR